VCGICGIFQSNSGASEHSRLLPGMLATLHHRGPDDEGVYLDDDVGLGMRRLSIIDIVGGAQPIYSEDGNVVIVFNGEIYNYRELRKRLQARGHTFRTSSDTEVIVHLYEEIGEDCVSDLRGMFAFAIWDKRQRRLLLARDRLGIKPLYYTFFARRLIFGSEIKAILRHPEVSAQLDPSSLSCFLSLKYVPSPSTLFLGISSLPPGHVLLCDRHGMTTKRYWDLSFAFDGNSRRTEQDYIEELEALLRECVQQHMVSDVPFGAFLSGGLDSSLVVALMSQFSEQRVKTFSIGFEGKGESFSELPFARLVADYCQTEHYEVILQPRHLVDLAEKVVWHLDQPIADDACLANHLVALHASRHVKMVLTGEGGDELFAGYARYAGEQLAPWFRHIPPSLLKLAVFALDAFPGMRRVKLALSALSEPDEVTRLTHWFPLLGPEMKTVLLSPWFHQEMRPDVAREVFSEHLVRTDAKHPLNRMLYVDTKLWLPDDLLARGDKMSMAASLEARVPLLDHKLVEFAASLPPDLKLRTFNRKYLLRKAARKFLPRDIIDRKKKGFPVPLGIWFRNEAGSFMRDLLAPSVIKRRGLFNPASVQKLIQEHASGFADHGSVIWALISLELWHRLFLDARTERRPEPETLLVNSTAAD